jgi:hypothetical protein
MKRIYPALFVLACYCLVFSPDTVVGQTVAAVPSAIMVAAIDQHTLEPSRSTSENANIPKPLMDLMQASRMKFLEGYSRYPFAQQIFPGSCAADKGCGVPLPLSLCVFSG